MCATVVAASVAGAPHVGAPVSAKAVAVGEAQARVAAHAAAEQELLYVRRQHLAAALETGRVRAAPIQGIPKNLETGKEKSTNKKSEERVKRQVKPIYS